MNRRQRSPLKARDRTEREVSDTEVLSGRAGKESSRGWKIQSQCKGAFRPSEILNKHSNVGMMLCEKYCLISYAN